MPKKTKTLGAAVILAGLAATPLLGQTSAPPNPLSAHVKHNYRMAKGTLLRAAEQMPEENYGFKPTEVVRSFGQMLGHVAEAQYFFCSTVLGEKSPAPKIEQTKTAKADLIAALKNAFAYCDKAYDGMTDASATQMVSFMGREQPKLGVLINNNMHTSDHYGQIVTYLRMKKIVPPTSDAEFMQQLRKS